MKYYTNSTKRRPITLSISYYVGVLCERLSFTFLIVSSLALLVFSKTNDNLVKDINLSFFRASRPIILVVQAPINMAHDVIIGGKNLVTVKHQNDLLRKKNRELEMFYLQASNLRHENKELKNLLNYVEDKEVSYKTARVLGDSHDLYTSNIIIDAGKKNGIKKGQLVVGRKGAIGRVTSVFSNKSRVLLINDVSSKIPIVTSNSNTRAIFSGNNVGKPKIIYLNDDHGVTKGEEVFTSGDGEALPPGILIGTINDVKESLAYVNLAENLNAMDLVMVIDYKEKSDEEKLLEQEMPETPIIPITEIEEADEE